jgi:hypothetical protein
MDTGFGQLQPKLQFQPPKPEKNKLPQLAATTNLILPKALMATPAGVP